MVVAVWWCDGGGVCGDGDAIDGGCDGNGNNSCGENLMGVC